jgi:protein-L-isoaspartate(D-aspartate) O-methyltransferase
MRTPIAATSLLLLFCLAACPGPEEADGDGDVPAASFEELRREMVDRIRDEGIGNEAVLSALLKVERHRFVDRAYRQRAYQVNPLPIGEGQTISSPYIVALMTELLELEADDKVLEIGTGSGYQAAILARLVPEVFTIEIRPALAEAARKRLQRLGFHNVNVRCGDGYKGWPEEAPFDAIIVTAAPPEVPDALVRQLAPGGVLVAPVGRDSRHQQLIVIRKDEQGKITREQGPRVIFVPMIQAD